MAELRDLSQVVLDLEEKEAECMFHLPGHKAYQRLAAARARAILDVLLHAQRLQNRVDALTKSCEELRERLSKDERRLEKDEGRLDKHRRELDELHRFYDGGGI